jgi:nitrite reductase/ring-hydroxylating ferredoxin subunit
MQESRRSYVVCPRAELTPGSMRALEIGRRSIAVVCVAEGEYRALSDLCPHEGARLSCGRLERIWVSGDDHQHLQGERLVVVCPWHNFEFDVESGRSVCEPHRLGLPTYSAGLEGDQVVVYA